MRLVLVLSLCKLECKKNKKVHGVDGLFAEYHCYKLKTCTSKEKVCGFDRDSSMLAVFEDRCTMLKANCMKYGKFHGVDMTVCEMQKAYQAQYSNDTFQFLHLTDRLLLRDANV